MLAVVICLVVTQVNDPKALQAAQAQGEIDGFMQSARENLVPGLAPPTLSWGEVKPPVVYEGSVLLDMQTYEDIRRHIVYSELVYPGVCQEQIDGAVDSALSGPATWEWALLGSVGATVVAIIIVGIVTSLSGSEGRYER